MNEIQLRTAKAKLSAVIDQAQQGQPSVITRHGRREAVVVSFEEWERLSRVPSFGRLLMSAPVEPGDLPERDRSGLRALDFQGVYLVDTNVVSAGAPGRVGSPAELMGWMERHSDVLYLSAITVAEIEDGIAKARREGAHRKAALLASWLETVLHLYGARVLPVDVAVARALGGLSDVAIAATAQVFGFTVLTGNFRHFQMLPVACCDPFVALPG